MSKQKVLFIVPHEDDEVFVGGPMILNLTQDPSYEVFVFIALMVIIILLKMEFV